MKPNADIEIRASRLKLAAFAVLAIVSMLWPAAVFFLRLYSNPHRADAYVLAFLSASLLAGAVGVAWLVIATLRGPIVTLTPAGFRHRRITGGLVPWVAITRVGTKRVNGINSMVLELEPNFFREFEGTRLFRISRAMGFRTLEIAGLELAISTEDLVARVRAYRDAVLATDPSTSSSRDEPKPKKHARPTFTKPAFATISILAVLILVFVAEVMSAPPGEGATKLSAWTLARFGGLNQSLVREGQWWRFLTAPVLHAGPPHLIGNSIALLLGGTMLERRIGWRWFVTIFAVSALAGGVASCLTNPPDEVTVGASGGISGLFAGVIVLAFREQDMDARKGLVLVAARLLLPSLIPVGRQGPVHIDFAAHIGGALGGLLVGAAAFATWRVDGHLPRQGRLITAMASAYVAATAVAFSLDAMSSWTVWPDNEARRSEGPPRTTALPRADPGTLYGQAKAGLASAEAELRRLALQGWPRAQTYMGFLKDPSLNKNAKVQDGAEAVRWYRMAALQDFPLAETNLGLLLAAHWPGVPSDYPQALSWLERVAPLSMAATRGLGLMYRDGHGVAADAAKSAALLKMAAERGDIIAEKLLAPIYDQGVPGVPAQPAEAVRMLRLASLQNDAEAMRRLAEHYEKGTGVAASPSDAIAWYARAASRGDADAQAYLKRTAPERSPPSWGATRPTIEPTAGDDARAERSRCVEERVSQAANRLASNLPTSFDEQKARSATLSREYGRDARVRYAHAAALYDADANDVAVVDLQCALDDAATWHANPYVQPFIYTLLARIDLDAGHAEDAKRAIAPACTSHHPSIAALDLSDLCPKTPIAAAASTSASAPR